MFVCSWEHDQVFAYERCPLSEVRPYLNYATNEHQALRKLIREKIEKETAMGISVALIAVHKKRS